MAQDVTNFIDKTHVEHTIDFIENDIFELLKPYLVAQVEVLQPPGRANHEVGRAAQAVDLGVNRHAADANRGIYPHILRESAQFVVNLERQLSGRSNNQDFFLLVAIYLVNKRQ